MNPKTPLLLGVAVLAFIALLGSADTVRAQTFDPTIETNVVDPTAGANSDFTLDLNIPGGDVNFASLVAFLPPDWGITPGDEIPLGAVVGQLDAVATLGLINAQCDNALTVQFKMLNASIDITDTVAFDDADDNGTGDVFEDKDDSGIQEAIEKYPEFINRITDDAQPIRRSAGIAIVAGVDVLLQFLIFEPGSVIIREIPTDESLGYPTVTFLQAIGDPDAEPEPGAITDFCTPLQTTNITYGISQDNPCTDDVPREELDPLCEVTSTPLEITGEGGTSPDEGGVPLFTNPEEGTHTFTVISLGQRDADGDGIENTLDTCPFDINQGDPRIKGDGDFDEDGLDAACDPNDDEVNSDQDADGYLNRQDNCPLVANGEEADNQEESDVNPEGDPRPDGIGDVCDPNPEVPDGDTPFAQVSSDVSIGASAPTDETPSADETPEASPTPSADGEDDGGGLGAGLIIIIVIGVIVVVGGGAFYVIRRGSA